MVHTGDTLHQIDLIDIYRKLHPRAAEYTFFPNTHGTFYRMDHMLGHKTSLSKFRETEIISSIFFDHSGMKLEIKYKKKTGKIINMWRLNNILRNNQWVNEEIQVKIKKHLETNEDRNTTYQNLEDAGKSVLREKIIVIQACLKKQNNLK